MNPDKLFFDADQLVSRGQLVLDLIKRTWNDMGKRRVNPQCEPGFLRQQLPNQAPEDPSTFEEVCKDTEEKYIPGVLHWQSPKFFAYYPNSTSDISIYAEMVAQAFVCPTFSFASSPSHTELENVMVDWTVTALNLPQKYLIHNAGGGVIMASVTEAVFLAMHAAKIKKMAEKGLKLDNPDILKLVGYYSETVHVSTSKALMLKDIPHRRAVPCYFDDTVGNYIIDLKQFRELVEADIKNGLIPFFYGATIGTTFSGAVDQIDEIGKICSQFGIWLSVDAAYLGSVWICQEFRDTQHGLARADSIAINLSKPLFMGSGGTMFYIADKKTFVKAMGSELQFSFYKNKYSDMFNTIDYKDWQVGLNHRNNSLRLYFLYKFFGMKALRESIRSRAKLAQHVQQKVIESKCFRLFSKTIFGLVCFQLNVQENRSQLTKELGSRIRDQEQGYCTPATFKDQSILRIVINNTTTRQDHINIFWDKIMQITHQFLAEKGILIR